MKRLPTFLLAMAATMGSLPAVAAPPAPDRAELTNLVKRSYQYVALYNTLCGFTLNDKNPFSAHGRPANMHLAISDATGDSAIFQYVDGKLVIYHSKDYKVLTNSPTYDKQLAIMEYWKSAGGLTKSLPGTSNAADRFVRASFLLGALPVETSKSYISGAPQQKFHFQAAMAVLSLMRSIGTPLGFSLADQPWVSSTIWRTVSGHGTNHRLRLYAPDL